MKALYVKDIADGKQVASDFLATRKSLLRSRTGSPYLALTLADSTGQIEARIWEDAERISAAFAEGDFVRVKGTSETYKGAVQLSLTDVTPLRHTEVDMGDFLPKAERDSREMLRELRALSRKVHDPHLKALLLSVFGDRELMEAFERAAAAKNMHHAYLGGLLEHTLKVAGLCWEVADHYPEVNRDLLLAGAILHDIGKVRELSSGPGFDYTLEGRLIGHILLGLETLDEKLARLPDFPPHLATALKHLIVSHHGEYEFGSPRRPKTAEAFLLHALDDLDAKLTAVRLALRETQPGTPAYHRVLERYVFGSLEGPPDEAQFGSGADDEETLSLLTPLMPKGSKGGD